MRSPADDIAHYLETAGVGALAATTGWAIAIAAEPPDPDNVVTIYDTAGGEPDTDQLDIFTPGVQVRVRCKDYIQAYQKQKDIRALLTLPHNLSMATSVFTTINMTSDVASLGRDTNARFILVSNYRGRRTEKEA